MYYLLKKFSYISCCLQKIKLIFQSTKLNFCLTVNVIQFFISNLVSFLDIIIGAICPQGCCMDILTLNLRCCGYFSYKVGRSRSRMWSHQRSPPWPPTLNGRKYIQLTSFTTVTQLKKYPLIGRKFRIHSIKLKPKIWIQ